MSNTTIAPLRNLSIAKNAVTEIQNSDPDMPKMAVFYGSSGYGKTSAACYLKNKVESVYVRAQSTWTPTSMLQAILNELNISPARRIPDMVNQVSEELALSERVLMVDEADHIAERKPIEVLRDIHDVSGAAILLIGEETLPAKLKRKERVHGRILTWAPAQPADKSDADMLLKFFHPDLKICPTFYAKIIDMAKGSVRRLRVNFNLLEKTRVSEGWDIVDEAKWAGRALYMGEAPRRNNKRAA